MKELRWGEGGGGSGSLGEEGSKMSDLYAEKMKKRILRESLFVGFYC
jgi:hypothetical protein